MKFSFILLLIVLRQGVDTAPVSDKSVEDGELDSWLDDIEQALDEEIPAAAEGMANSKPNDGGVPALDRTGKLANSEGDLVDMEEPWEDEEDNFSGKQ